MKAVQCCVGSRVCATTLRLLWTMMLCVVGHKAGVAACAKELSGRLKVGAAVASMLQLGLLKSASTGSPSAQAAAAATGSFSAAHGPAALLRAACAACMTVVADANEATSLAELENAFWVVDTACALGAELPQEVVPRAASYTHSTSTAAATSSDLAAAVNGPGSSRAANQEALRCQQQDGVGTGGAAVPTGTEHVLACARAAHDAMVRHSDQGVCMSALKALKVRRFPTCWPTLDRSILAECPATCCTSQRGWR